MKNTLRTHPEVPSRARTVYRAMDFMQHGHEKLRLGLRKQAIECYKTALDMFKESKDEDRQAEAVEFIRRVEEHITTYATLAEKLDAFRELNNEEKDADASKFLFRENAIILMLRGLRWCRQGSQPDAIKHYEAAIQAFKELNDEERQAQVHELIRRANAIQEMQFANAIQEMQFARKKSMHPHRNEAIEHYNAAIDLFKKLNDEKRQAEVKELIRCENAMILGDEQIELGRKNVQLNIHAATRAFKKAITHYKNARNVYMEAQANGNMVLCLKNQGMDCTAKKYEIEVERLKQLNAYNVAAVGGADGEPKGPTAR